MNIYCKHLWFTSHPPKYYDAATYACKRCFIEWDPIDEPKEPEVVIAYFNFDLDTKNLDVSAGI